jgi:hypothetical protein
MSTRNKHLIIHHRFPLIAATCGTVVAIALAGVARGEEPAPAPAAEPAPAPTVTPAVAEAAAPAPAATAVAPAAPSVAAPAPPPPPYSLPWQLRPVAAVNVLRSDTAVAFYDNGMGASGSTVATMFLASYKVTPSLAPMVRLGFSQNDAPATGADGKSFINPIVGATFAKKVDAIRWAAFLGATIPVGMGAGDMPDPGANLANSAGIRARSAMDNAMFAVNYLTVIAGGDIAYVDHKLTVQLEATLLQLMRVRGENAASATDSARTNSTVGLHAGYFLVPMLSIGGEFRYQRWLSTPTQITNMMKVDIADFAKETVTVAIGPRFHFQVSKGLWLRPGIAYARGLDRPLTDASYNVVQVDVPFYF